MFVDITDIIKKITLEVDEEQYRKLRYAKGGKLILSKEQNERIAKAFKPSQHDILFIKEQGVPLAEGILCSYL